MDWPCDQDKFPLSLCVFIASSETIDQPGLIVKVALVYILIRAIIRDLSRIVLGSSKANMRLSSI